LYAEIINHPGTSDELRRSTESKLLRHKQRYLFALPSTGEAATTKAELAADVADLVNGVVLLEIPDELAWTMHLESKDVDTLGRYGHYYGEQELIIQYRGLRFRSVPPFYKDLPFFTLDEDDERIFCLCKNFVIGRCGRRGWLP
jgi:hypothetical protein